MKFASLEENLGGGLSVSPILLLSLPASGRRPHKTEILLTGSLSLNSIKNNLLSGGVMIGNLTVYP